MSKQSPRSSPSRSPNAGYAPTHGASNAKMPGWHVKRPEHRDWPQPTLAPDDRITIIAA